MPWDPRAGPDIKTALHEGCGLVKWGELSSEVGTCWLGALARVILIGSPC